MEAGVHERLIHRMNGELVKRLQQTSHQLHYRDVVGGHDALCWRGGLMDGLAMLWSPHFVVTTAAVREVEGVCDGKP